MDDDGVIRVGTEVDISGVKAGMKEAEDVVKSSTSAMDASYKQLAATTAEYSVTSANLRAVIKQLVEGQVPYKLAVDALTPALMEQSVATKALQAAKAQLAAQEAEATAVIEAQNEALVSNALAQTAAATAADELAVSNRLASASASIAGREVGGFLGGQIGRVAAQSEALAPIFAAAFPIAAAAGAAMIVYQLGEKIVEMRKKANEAADNIAISFGRMTDSVRSSSDSLISENERLQGQLDKLLGHPGENGLKIAFDEAATAADKLSVSIDRDIDRMHQLVDITNQKNSIGFWESLWSGQAETGETQKTIQNAIKGIQAVNDEYSAVVQRAADSGDKANLAQAQESQLAALQKAYKSAEDQIYPTLKRLSDAQYDYEQSGKVFGKDQTANIKMLQGALKELAEEQRNIGLQYRDELLQQKVTPAREQHDAAGGENSAAVKQLRAIESELAKLQEKEAAVTGHGLTAGEGLAFWAQYLTTFKDGSEQAKQVLDQYAKYQEEFHKQLQAIVKGAKKSSSEDVHMEPLTPGLEKWLASQDDSILQTGDAWKEYHSAVLKAQEISAQAAESIQLATVNARAASGSLSPLAAAEERAAIHAADFKVKLAALNDELDRLRKAGTYDALGNNVDAKNAAQQQQIKNQIAQLQGQMKAGAVSDQASIQQQIAQPYLKAFDQINSSWLRVQNQMFYSTRNLSLEFAKMGQSILISIVDSLEKAALRAAEHEAVMVIQHQLANQAKVTSDAATAVESEGIANASLAKKLILQLLGLSHHVATNAAKTASDATSAVAGTAAAIPANIAAAESYAAVAGVAAMASAAAIPVVGFAMAPGVGAGVYAVGQGFAAMASLDTGTGYVPRDGLAAIHQGEIIVPAPTADELRNGSGGGDIHITQHNNVHMANDREFRRQLDRHADAVAGAVRKQLRQGGRA